MLQRLSVLALALGLLMASVSSLAEDTRPTFEGRPVYRVGGGILPPKPIDAPDPAYPKKMRKKRIEGRVVLKLVVGTDGAPHEITVSQSGGKEFDLEAVKAVQQWKFQPATKDGEPVDVAINVDVRFHLYD